MNPVFLSVVIITALLYFFVSPDIVKNQYIVIRAYFAIAGAVGSFILLYIIQLPFTGFNLLLWFLINAAIALSFNNSLTNHKNGAIVSGVALAVIILFWIGGITVLSALSATQLAAAPDVTVARGPSEIINSSHIRLVSYETAQWRSDKVIGSLGYKSQITEPDIQTRNGTLVWITPLDYAGFFIKAWSYADEGTGGYVIVNAEDPKAEAQMVSINRMIYTRGALFGNKVNRRVWEQHPEFLQMETSFQLDDKMQPQYVVQLAEPMLYGCIGERPVGVATIDPVSGTWIFTASANSLHGSNACGARPQPKNGSGGGAATSLAGGTPSWGSVMLRYSPVLTNRMYFSSMAMTAPSTGSALSRIPGRIRPWSGTC